MDAKFRSGDWHAQVKSRTLRSQVTFVLQALLQLLSHLIFHRVYRLQGVASAIGCVATLVSFAMQLWDFDTSLTDLERSGKFVDLTASNWGCVPIVVWLLFLICLQLLALEARANHFVRYVVRFTFVVAHHCICLSQSRRGSRLFRIVIGVKCASIWLIVGTHGHGLLGVYKAFWRILVNFENYLRLLKDGDAFNIATSLHEVLHSDASFLLLDFSVYFFQLNCCHRIWNCLHFVPVVQVPVGGQLNTELFFNLVRLHFCGFLRVLSL